MCVKSFFKVIFPAFFLLLLMGCSESNDTNSDESDPALNEGLADASEDSENQSSQDLDEHVEEVYEYQMPSSPIVNTETFKGFIDDKAVEVILNIHKDSKVSGSYSYEAYQEPIALIGTKIMDDYYQEVTYELLEWEDTMSVNGFWHFYPISPNHVIGDWSNFDKSLSLPLELISKNASGYLTPLSAVLFQSKEEAEDFYARHKYINNASQGKMSVLCRGDNTVGDYLPKGITVYNRYKEGKGFELEPIGSVVHYDRFAFDTTDVTYRVEGLMSLIHSTPAESYHGIRLVGPSRSISGELYMTNIKDPELAFKLKDLEDMGWHLEGDAYHLKETMKVGLDMNHQFSKEYPLRLLKGPRQSELVLGEYVNDDNLYVIIEDVQYLNSDYWLKVKIMSEKSKDYHSLTNGKLEKTGWIKLYSKTSNFTLNSLSLSYYGNGC